MATIFYEDLIKLIKDSEIIVKQDVTPGQVLAIYFEGKTVKKASKTIHFEAGVRVVILDLDENDHILSIEIT